jgi:hypothetical protein
MRRAAVAGALVAASCAHTRPDDWRGGAWLHYEASYVHRREPGDPMDGIGMAGLRLKGFVSKKLPIGYLAGIDLHAGSTNPGGFAYQTNLYFLGAGMRLGSLGTAGIGTGIGASGAVGTVDDGVELPVEAFLELGVGAHLRLLARGRAVWLGAASARHRGAPSVAFTDEVDATVGIRVGRRYHEFGFPSGNGYFAGVAYREWMGAQFVGAVFGYSVDVGSR